MLTAWWMADADPEDLEVSYASPETSADPKNITNSKANTGRNPS